MKYIILLKMVLSLFLSFLINIRNKINYIFKNPTCKFYKRVVIIDSILEGINILFDHTQVISSTLGMHTYVQKRSSIVNAEIGKFCSIASNVSIGPGIHKIDGVSTHPSFYLINTPLIKSYVNKDMFESSKRTFIGHDVWIGEGVVIIDGVKIGTGAIIAAGAVVTKDVNPYSIVGGVPAKHIKYRFELDIVDLLLKSEWWNYSDDWFLNNTDLMYNTSHFINYLKNDQKNS